MLLTNNSETAFPLKMPEPTPDEIKKQREEASLKKLAEKESKKAASREAKKEARLKVQWIAFKYG